MVNLKGQNMSFLDGGGTDGRGGYDMSKVAQNSTYGRNPPVVIETNYADNFAPGNLAGGATSMLDVLKYGFGRVVDYKTASLQAQNVPPNYVGGAQSPVLVSVPQKINTTTLLLIGAGVLGFLMLTSGGKKD
ncbi:MAG: hypothetical protein EAZ11_12295 [Curvibacter sp.]|nr:MAG: hypothetical protein EAZ11_12295 [Curvibacter sp.]